MTVLSWLKLIEKIYAVLAFRSLMQHRCYTPPRADFENSILLVNLLRWAPFNAQCEMYAVCNSESSQAVSLSLTVLPRV